MADAIRDCPRREEIAGLILAGGGGRRFGGVDKGHLELDGRPLVVHVLDRLAPQVAAVMISANEHAPAYRYLDLPVVGDRLGAGPLAGLHAGLVASPLPWLVLGPCDGPFLPRDLVARLAGAWPGPEVVAVVPHDGRRLQPLFGLYHRDLRPALEDYLASGNRRVDEFVSGRPHRVVDLSDAADGFLNLNRPEDMVVWNEQVFKQRDI